jgi:bifunctional oligoribonuclease and PAP phosphatase NrnA
MTIDWSPLKDLIETHDRFLVTTHVRPDGDALGSEVGMAGLLRQKGKDVRVVNSSPMPPRYDFLDPDKQLFEWFGAVVKPAQLADREVAIILDLSSWNQLGDMAELIRRFPGPRVVIDHHVSQDDLGATVFKDSTAEATGMLVLKAFPALGGQLTPEISQGLLTAIAMDTGWFHHSNTRAGTLRAVADLVDAGAPINQIYRNLFEQNTLARLKLIGETLRNLKTDMGGRVAYATITKDDLLKSGAIPQDSEDLVDFTVSLRGVDLGLLFSEQLRGGAKVSIRTRSGVDCAALAAQFGGGGHKEAAGATINAPMAECVTRVLEAARRTLVAQS